MVSAAANCVSGWQALALAIAAELISCPMMIPSKSTPICVAMAASNAGIKNARNRLLTSALDFVYRAILPASISALRNQLM